MKLPKSINLLRLFAVPLLLGIAFLPIFASFVPVHAEEAICGNNNIPQQVQAANGCSEGGELPTLKGMIESIVNGVIAVGGVVAVIFIVVGGFNYMTSSGDAQKVQKAKATIMYACIGLAIVALSFIIVNFVIVDLIGGGNAGGDDGVQTVGDNKHNLAELVGSIVRGVIAVLGVVCVIFMVVGGVNYMTSTGDAQKVEKGKKTLLYAAIGLVICVLAFAITNFVIYNLIGGKKEAIEPTLETPAGT